MYHTHQVDMSHYIPHINCRHVSKNSNNDDDDDDDDDDERRIMSVFHTIYHTFTPQVAS